MASSSGRQLLGRDVAGDADREPVAGEVAGDEGAAVVDGDRGDALGRAAARAAVGVPGEGRGEPGARGEIVGVGLAPAQVGQDLAAHPLDRLGIEARLGHGETQEIEGVRAVGGERPELARDPVAVGLEMQPQRVVVDLGAEGLAVVGAGALVEQPGGHEGQALPARGVGGTAAADVQGEERNGTAGSRIR